MNNKKGLAAILIVLLVALGIGGYLIYQKQPKPVSQPSPSPIASSSAETANWKTYTNTKLNIAFDIPQTWTVNERDRESLEIKPRNYKLPKAVIDIFVYDNLKNLSLEELNKELTGPSGYGPQLYSASAKKVKLQSNITADYSLCIIDGPARKCEQYVFENKNKVFHIRNVVAEDETVADQQQIFDQILSTFKFLDQNDDLSSSVTIITNAVAASDFATVIANQDMQSRTCPAGGICPGMEQGETITGYKIGPAYSEFQLVPKGKYSSFLKEYFTSNAPLIIYQPKSKNETKIIYYNSVNKSFILFSLQQNANKWQIGYSLYGKTDSIHTIDSVNSL